MNLICIIFKHFFYSTISFIKIITVTINQEVKIYNTNEKNFDKIYTFHNHQHSLYEFLKTTWHVHIRIIHHKILWPQFIYSGWKKISIQFSVCTMMNIEKTDNIAIFKTTKKKIWNVLRHIAAEFHRLCQNEPTEENYCNP